MILKHELGAIDTERAMELTPMGRSAAASRRRIDATEATGPRLVGAVSWPLFAVDKDARLIQRKNN